MMDSIDDFAAAHVARLHKKLRKEARRAARHPDEEPIHDLRVSIRRLSQCLEEFRRLLPRHKTKKTLKQLHKLMDLAAEMRNRDIAIALVGTENSSLAANFAQEREQAKRKLTRALDRWRHRDSA